MSHQYPGALLTFEGIDGAGKTELLDRVAQELEAKGFDVVVTKEPGGTHIGRMLKKVLLEEEKECSPRVEFLLFAADRAEHFSHLVIPALKRGAIVLSDRMADSSFAYQGFGRGLNCTFIRTVNHWAMHEIVPDLTFYIHTPYDVALKRRNSRAGEQHTIEQEQEQFWLRVIAGYQHLAKHNTRFTTLDGTLSRDKVFKNALASLKKLIDSKPELSCNASPSTNPVPHSDRLNSDNS